MKILLVASEATPFAKTGGLADVAGALPKALKQLGHDVRIIMPFYSEVQGGGFAVRKGRKSVEVEIEGAPRKGFMRQSSLDGIPVYFIENREYFQRKHLYGTPAGDYPDNPQRYAFFCRGVLQLLKKMDFRPDIIHCNDWQTALIPLLLKYELAMDPFFMKTASLYTIHNLAYQGLFPPESLAAMGLDWSYFTLDRLEYYGNVNLMKGAILSADIVNTVSETYCREVLTKEMGCGLEGVLAARGEELHGVLNGIDYSEWDPETDGEICRRFSASAMGGKAYNKRAMQKELGLADEPDIPLLAMVSRLAAQKGLDLLVENFSRLKKARIQLVVLGSGDETYIRALEALRKEGGENISINISFEPKLAHRIYAASDIFLMPSRYEPCGLGQLIALRYGAVPVARKTGGLADTVIDPLDNQKEANGFVFEEYTPKAFWRALERAIEAYADQRGWKKMVRQGMGSDFSWKRSAVKYEELYRLALARKVL